LKILGFVGGSRLQEPPPLPSAENFHVWSGGGGVPSAASPPHVQKEFDGSSVHMAWLLRSGAGFEITWMGTVELVQDSRRFIDSVELSR
jgi:hypothetical protein